MPAGRPVGNPGRPTNQTTEPSGMVKPGTGKMTTRGFVPHPEGNDAASRALARNQQTQANIRRK
jgi:hypothetical protein